MRMEKKRKKLDKTLEHIYTSSVVSDVPEKTQKRRRSRQKSEYCHVSVLNNRTDVIDLVAEAEKENEKEHSKKGSLLKLSPRKRVAQLIEMYVDTSDNRLRSEAIDRFCSAACKKSEIELQRIKQTAVHSLAIRDVSRLRKKGKIFWISSLAFEAALTASNMSHASRESVRKKMGFLANRSTSRGVLKEEITASTCDIILGSVHSNGHWSLLVVYMGSKGPGTVYHYDSIANQNAEKAAQITTMLSRVGILNPRVNLIAPADFPQQSGEYECGHVVILTVGAIQDKYRTHPFNSTEPLAREDYPDISEERLERLRQDIVNRVIGAEAERRHRSF